MADFKKIEQLEKRLWTAADSLRANTGLTAQEYSRPILGLIFLKYAEYRFMLAKDKLADQAISRRRGSDGLKSKIQAEGAMYVPDEALYSKLLALPEGSNIGIKINIRLDQDLKDRSFSVLESYGLTPSQAIRLFLNQVADTNAIPLSFDYQQPKLNAQTLAAIAEVASGNGTKYDSFGDLMDELEGEADEIH